jgi:hypothetical protein
MRLNADQMAAVRDILTQELDQDRQENGYLPNQLALRYEDREAEAAGSSPLPDTAALAGAAIQQAAQVPARRAFSGSS